MSPRAVVISTDRTVSRTLARGALAAGFEVDVRAAAELEPKAFWDLALVHLTPPEEETLAAANAAAGALLCAIDTSDLGAAVDAMRACDRVRGVITSRVRSIEIAAAARRALSGELLGLEKATCWGPQIHQITVADYDGKSACLAHVSEHAAAMGIRPKYLHQIERCLDEMLMNALYDAPVDERGRPRFANLPPSSRSSLAAERPVGVEYAFDGDRFHLGVRDDYGSLSRDTVLRYLRNCLALSQPVDDKAGGAGLGLYLMANSGTNLIFNLVPGVATEVVCCFDLAAPRMQLEQLSIFEAAPAVGERECGIDEHREPLAVLKGVS